VIAHSDREWLEPDGLGGFASHTNAFTRTRRYHALLLISRNPPVDRRVLVNGVDIALEIDGERVALTSQTYAPPEGGDPVVRFEGRPSPAAFTSFPFPTWTHDLGSGRAIVWSVFRPRGSRLVALQFALMGGGVARLVVRPLLSGRDYHSLHHENPDFNFTAQPEGGERVIFQPYASEPAVAAVSNGEFHADGYWYRDFLYVTDRERGLDCTEDLGSPGVFTFELGSGHASLVLGTSQATHGWTPENLDERLGAVRAAEEARRREDATPLLRASRAFLVDRGEGRTILAGYPWFTDWGRDTFIAVRGLCIATGRLGEARRVLVQWARAVSQGMLPNRFTDSGEAPEYNSVDASLWFIVAVHDLRAAEKQARVIPSTIEEWQLNAAILAILKGYAEGTRHGIRMDSDHLLAAGEPGSQVTWMDAKVGDLVVTPRIGKPVEIQALWINALRSGAAFDDSFGRLARAAEASLNARFWNEETGYLYDVVDVDHVPGRLDGRVRPNALFTIGGLPHATLHGERARAVVDLAERRLLTAAGPRSLAPDEPQYRGVYEGGVLERDTAYHQGTVWPWLMGAFVEAWTRVRGDSGPARAEARRTLFEPFLETLDPDGNGLLPEIADGDPPHRPRGCPFQAWSVGEALRLDRLTLKPR
jgi:predicted glycogen debranching enzyme